MAFHPGLRCALTDHKTWYAHRVIFGDTCPTLDNPTLADLVEDVRRDHDKDCSCGAQIGPKVWLARIFRRWESTVGIEPSLLEEYDIKTPLHEFSKHLDAAEVGTVHIFVQSVPPQNPVPRTRDEPPEFFDYHTGTVFRIPGPDHRLPIDAYVPYADMCKTPGLLLVDKSRFVSPQHTQPEAWRLPVIRRPKGFGKTTFLSLLEAYVDVNRNDGLFPRAVFGPLPAHLNGYLCPGLLLVFHLDLAELKVYPEMPEAIVRDACRDLLTGAATACYMRYRDRLHYNYDKETFAQVTFPGLVGMAREQGRSLFVGIDNYTAPLATTGACPYLEDIIVQEVFDPIFTVWPSNTIRRGFMVGDDDLLGPTFWPYSASPSFFNYTIELTHEPIAFEVLGMTENEIMALGRALLRPDLAFLQQVRQRACVPAEEMQDGPCRGRMYSLRDVLAFAGAPRASPNDPAVAGSTVKSITYDDCLPPTRYLPPGLLVKAVEIWKQAFLSDTEPTTPSTDAASDAKLQQPNDLDSPKLSAMPRWSDTGSDNGSQSDDSAHSSIGSLPPRSNGSNSSD